MKNVPNMVDTQCSDAAGNPAGGSFNSTGVSIDWQNGPLGRDGVSRPQNGAMVEDVITAVIARIEFYQRSIFACEENAGALTDLRSALAKLHQRTSRRKAAGIEGTHAEVQTDPEPGARNLP